MLLTGRCAVIGCFFIDLVMLIDTNCSMIVRFTSPATRCFLSQLLSSSSLFSLLSLRQKKTSGTQLDTNFSIRQCKSWEFDWRGRGIVLPTRVYMNNIHTWSQILCLEFSNFCFRSHLVCLWLLVSVWVTVLAVVIQELQGSPWICPLW